MSRQSRLNYKKFLGKSGIKSGQDILSESEVEEIVFNYYRVFTRSVKQRGLFTPNHATQYSTTGILSVKDLNYNAIDCDTDDYGVRCWHLIREGYGGIEFAKMLKSKINPFMKFRFSINDIPDNSRFFIGLTEDSLEDIIETQNTSGKRVGIYCSSDFEDIKWRTVVNNNFTNSNVDVTQVPVQFIIELTSELATIKIIDINNNVLFSDNFSMSGIGEDVLLSPMIACKNGEYGQDAIISIYEICVEI